MTIMDDYIYRTIQVGFLLLTIGIILGGVWANQSWGRYWDWDPKETWAFISWIVYAAYLHLRVTGWARGIGAAIMIGTLHVAVSSLVARGFAPNEVRIAEKLVWKIIMDGEGGGGASQDHAWSPWPPAWPSAVGLCDSASYSLDGDSAGRWSPREHRTGSA